MIAKPVHEITGRAAQTPAAGMASAVVSRTLLGEGSSVEQSHGPLDQTSRQGLLRTFFWFEADTKATAVGMVCGLGRTQFPLQGKSGRSETLYARWANLVRSKKTSVFERCYGGTADRSVWPAGCETKFGPVNMFCCSRRRP